MKAASTGVALLLSLLVVEGGFARAGETNVAVAANFAAAAEEIGTRFESETGHEVRFSFGSTGQLYAQITQGAPFDAFLAADQARPKRAIAEAIAVAGSRFTYATGRIVLYSVDPGLVMGPGTLTNGDFAKIALANPKTAPYGAAAVAAMKALGVFDRVAGKMVFGNNIAQTHQFVVSGGVPLGFVALSQVAGEKGGSRWLVPGDLYPVIAQDAVLLVRGASNEATRQFLAFLRGPDAREIKVRFGYGSGD